MSVLDPNLIDSNFPMQSYRKGQREAISSIVDIINTGKKFVIAELPTGSGKSAIAVTLARLASAVNTGVTGAYYIVTTKILQDQIMKDFGEDSGVVTLKGRSNYACSIYEKFPNYIIDQKGNAVLKLGLDEKPSCLEGYCKKYRDASKCFKCVPPVDDPNYDRSHLGDRRYSTCDYFEKYYSAANSSVASMNFDNFIIHLNFGRGFFRRKILIIDEAHNTEDKLLSFLETTINSKQLLTTIPKFDTAVQYVDWLESIAAGEVIRQQYEYSKERADLKTASMYESLMQKYVLFVNEVRDDPEGWVVEHTIEGEGKDKTTSFTAKPIFVKSAARRLLFRHADVVVFLSATILNANTFANNLGIEPGEFAAFREHSNFPVKNRPIILDYAGKFTGGTAKQDVWIGLMVDKITNIARKHKDHRGIVHTHSFNIQKGILDSLPSDVRSRMISQADHENKNDLLAVHARTPNSIIIAPAMHEGVDLKDDLSRFQIVCKVPYANYYANKQLMQRMELDPPYYDYITIMKLVQSVGRSVRSETDWAYTYIIDQAFDRLYSNSSSFPKWFKEAVTRNVNTTI